MAERRMFAKTIIDSDAFLDMPISARLLYYDLAMRADDDGFVNSPKKIMRTVGATTDDLKILALRKFIITFDNGIIVIKHWRIHNYIRKDSYNETPYLEQKAHLVLDKNNAYTIKSDQADEPTTECQQTVDDTSTQVRLGKDSIGDIYVEFPAKDSEIDEGKDNEFTTEHILDVLCKEYQTRRNNKAESRKSVIELLKGKKTYKGLKYRVQLNHVQLYFAVRQYMLDCKNAEFEPSKILLLSTFLNGRVLDYVERTRHAYEEYMQREYGKNWQNVKFTYRE